MYQSFSRIGFPGFAFSEFKGFAGGITMGWKANKLQVHILKSHFRFLHSRIIIEEGKIWHLSVFYAIPLEDKKKELWNELTNIVHTMSSCLLGGLLE